MNQNRREFIVRSSLAAAAGALVPGRLFAQGQATAAAPQPPTVPMFASLRRNVGTFTARGGTMGWLVGPDAVVVIDSQFADTSKMFLDGFKPMIGGRKIDLLINTHHHPDHTGGNKVLQPSVVKMVAQENAPGLQRKQAAAQKSEDQQAYADTTCTRPTGKSILEARSSRAALLVRATPAATGSSSSSGRTSSTWAT